MDTHSTTLLKNLLAVWPPNTVATSIWLEQQGISRFLRRQYVKSGWIKSIGYGAVIRPHEKVDWPGAVWALQNQLSLPIHIGGKSAISMQGRSHFLQFGRGKLTCFIPTGRTVPKWFLNGAWNTDLNIVKTKFLQTSVGLTTQTVQEIDLTISSLERAILELLYLSPHKASFDEINLIFENLTTLRPDIVQELLMTCKNYRVVRLFLYLSEVHQHSWARLLDYEKISIGSGVLQLEKAGVFSKKYQMTVPKELVKENKDEGSIF